MRSTKELIAVVALTIAALLLLFIVGATGDHEPLLAPYDPAQPELVNTTNHPDEKVVLLLPACHDSLPDSGSPKETTGGRHPAR